VALLKKPLIFKTWTANFFETVNLPEKLSIDINLDNVKNVETAKTYKAGHTVFDNQNQKLIDAFMKNSITEKKIWAVGPQFIASSGNTQEFLNIYDGGKSFGTETSVKRGDSVTLEWLTVY